MFLRRAAPRRSNTCTEQLHSGVNGGENRTEARVPPRDHRQEPRNTFFLVAPFTDESSARCFLGNALLTASSKDSSRSCRGLAEYPHRFGLCAGGSLLVSRMDGEQRGNGRERILLPRSKSTSNCVSTVVGDFFGSSNTSRAALKTATVDLACSCSNGAI